MDRVIPPSLRDRVFVYLDYPLIISETFEEHLDTLLQVAEQLRVAGLTINVEKSKFLVPEVTYLGYVVSRDGVRVDPDKVSAIEQYPEPKNVKQVRRFLGMAGYYRRFIANYSDVSLGLTNLLKGAKGKFTWTKEAEESFKWLKKALVSSPVLISPDYTKPFILACDASRDGVGCALMQSDQEGNERPVAFMSKKLNSAQKNYSVTELECLAAVLGVKKFRPYLEGQAFTIVTDHASLKWLMQQKELSGRLARWSLKLQAFNFNIEHRKGTQNIVPDALSKVFPIHEIAEVEV